MKYSIEKDYVNNYEIVTFKFTLKERLKLLFSNCVEFKISLYELATPTHEIRIFNKEDKNE